MEDASSASKYSFTVILDGGRPWGIRLQGGCEFSQKLSVAKVNPNSKAYRQGVQMGDQVDSINGQSTEYMNHRDALRLFQDANEKLELELTRTRTPSSVPVLHMQSPNDQRGGPHDDLAQEMTNGGMSLDRKPQTLPSAVVWSPLERTQKVTYQPVFFDPTGQSRKNRRVRNSSAAAAAAAAVSRKEYDSADEVLISQPLPLPLKHPDLPVSSIPSGRRRHPRHLSDPGFTPKQSLRPPISDNIQLSRRSRQFNFWNHFYPRNFSDPSVMTRPAVENPSMYSSNQPRPPVFTSVEEFQRHYGSCYTRTMPLRKRISVRLTNRPSSAPSSPQMKHVQFVPTDSRIKVLPDSDDCHVDTYKPSFSDVETHSASVSPVVLRDEDLLFDDSEVDLDPMSDFLSEPESGGQQLPSENVTSSMTLRLSEHNKAKKDTEINRRLMIKNEEMSNNNSRKTTEDSDVLILQNALDPQKCSSGLRIVAKSSSSAKSTFPPDVVDVFTTSKLELMKTDEQKSESPVQTLLKKSPALSDEEVGRNDKVRVISVKSSVKSRQPNVSLVHPNASHLPESEGSYFESAPFMSESDSEMSQREWYRQVFTALHKVDKNPEIPIYVLDREDKVIPPRPKTLDKISDDSSQSDNSKEREKLRPAQKGVVEIAPCGVRYISKPERSTGQNLESKLVKKSSTRSSQTSSVLPDKETRRPFHSKEPNLKAVKQTRDSEDDTRKKNDETFLNTDEYWLKLAGLVNACEKESSSAGQLKVPTADRVSAEMLSAKAVALYSFRANTERELSFNEGDTISLLRPIDKNWLEAEHNGAVGFVPRNYVKLISGTATAAAAEPEKILAKVMAKHNFTAKFPPELSFNKGDVLNVIKRIDNNWYEGKLDQRTGIFPITYVEPLTMQATPLEKVIISAVVESPASVSSGTSILSSIVPHSGPKSPYNGTSTSHQTNLSKDVFDFDKLFENYQNLNTAKKDQQLGIKYRNERNHETTAYVASNGGAATIPMIHTTSVSSVKDGKPSDVNQKQEDAVLSTTVQSRSIYESVSKGTDFRSSTPSLHLLYEEPWYQVLYNYSPQHDDELDLREGDLIYLLERCDDGWCVGQSDRTKRVGTFPSNYVTKLG